MTLFNPEFVDACVLDRYLSRLADNTAQLTSRLEALEQRLDSLEKSEKRLFFLDDQFEKVKDISDQSTHKIKMFDGVFASMQKQLDQIHTKAQEMQKAVERLESGVVINQIVRDKTRVENINISPDSGKRIEIVASDFSVGGYLRWDSKLGNKVKKGEVIAFKFPSKDISVCKSPIGSPVEGILMEKSFPDGQYILGSSVVIGYIQSQ